MGFLLERNNYGDRTAFYCMIVIDYEDGEKQYMTTGPDWTARDSNITFSEIYDGEMIDETRKCSARAVHKISYPFSRLVPQTDCGICKQETLQPVKQFITPSGQRVIDFGQNIAGWISLKGRGERGSKVTIRHFEVLDADGNAYYDNLRTAKQEFTIIFNGEVAQKLEPHFTYMGFRYIEIISSSDSCKLDELEAHALYSDMRPAGTFACSEPLVNQLHNNIQWSMKSNFVGIPTDCPQRDERCGWTGDAQIFSKTAAYLMNVHSFFENWLADMAADQTVDGGIGHIVPDILTTAKENDNWLVANGTHSASGWADAIVIVPWLMYCFYGDRKILAQYYDNMKAWIDFMTANVKDGVFQYGIQLGDWLALDAEEGSYYGATPNAYVSSAYYAYSCRLFAKISGLLGKEEQIRTYEKFYRDVKKTFQKHYIGTDGLLTVDTQTAYILALHFQLLPEKMHKQAAAHLVELIRQAGGQLMTGFIGTPYSCYALSENGYKDEAYQLLLRQEYPSWLYEVTKGATTVWEHWDGIKPDGSMWKAEMNSFNHYAYGAIGEWLYHECAGIQVDEAKPGFQNWIIRPCIGAFQWVKASYQSGYGKAAVSWSMIEERQSCKKIVELQIEIPVNTTADLIVDDCRCMLQNDDILMIQTGPFHYEGSIQSGSYTLQYVWNDNEDVSKKTLE